ncbi:MAG: asparagine synthase (glutamine-hydrolyzing) [Phycisphaerales bacterium JB063]
MCGIAGYIPNTPHAPGDTPERLARMLHALAHRGPDGQGQHIDPDTGVALGHTRLSIIDLTDDGRQPMFNEDGQIAITYNGEVYNYPALRDELIAHGHTFQSHTDTEVLVHGYEQWGLAGLLDRLRGMYAFAIYDKPNHAVHLARDPAGIKPLFLRRDESGVTFASEPKAIAAFDDKPLALSRTMLAESLHHMAVPSPNTVYADVQQLEPGTSQTIQLNGEKDTTQRHWQWTPKPTISDADQAKTQVWQAIVRSVERHLIADVPVGVFLSAGLDSSLIAVACAELGVKPTCLTLAIDDPCYDESPIAADLCKRYGFDHWVHRMGVDESRRWNDQIGDIYDEPFSATAALTALEVCGVAAERFKVMLSGDGGDEVFGGYSWYGDWLDTYNEDGRGFTPIRRLGNTLRSLAGRRTTPTDPVAGYAQLVGALTDREIHVLFAPGIALRPARAAYDKADRFIQSQQLAGFNRMQSMDMAVFLPDVCLNKMDRASMHHSLEVRVPLLDRDLVDLVGSIDCDARNPQRERKGLLRQIALDKLPASVLHKPKQGFSIKTRKWFPQDQIVAEIQRDMRNGDWWQSVFHPQVDRAVMRLRGRTVWRFWQTWRWVKQHVHENGAPLRD